jgi:hypothetical protein
MIAYPKLKTVTPTDDFNLLLVFENGEKRVFDFKPNLTHKFFQPLTNLKFFKNVFVVDGEIRWATVQDFCPHTLYEKSISALDGAAYFGTPD